MEEVENGLGGWVLCICGGISVPLPQFCCEHTAPLKYEILTRIFFNYYTNINLK